MQSKMPVVLITGASSGIGAATAKLFTSQGFHVFGTSRKKQANHAGVEMLELDVQGEEPVRHCVREVLRRAGQIDVLINNAGTMLDGSFAEETNMKDAHSLFETNFFGVARMINAVLPGMRERKQGCIINIGSLAAWVGEPGEAFYSASKHALAGYTEALCHEVWALGIHVSLIEPGAFNTPIYKEQSVKTDGIKDYDTWRKAVRETMLKAARHGDDPDKVARLILKVAQSERPRLRYGIGSEAKWLPYLKVLLPQRLLAYMLRKSFGLTNKG